MIGYTRDDMGNPEAGIRRFCELRNTAGKPVYAYQFAHALPDDEAGSHDMKGAFHSSELWFMFKSLEHSDRPFTQADWDLANRAADEALAEALSEKGITIDEETLRYAQDNKTGALEDNNDACHAERSEASVSAPELTQRELEILPMIAAGMTSKEIAARLFLTQQTIKWRRQRLLEKFDAKNTAEMLSKAREAGML